LTDGTGRVVGTYRWDPYGRPAGQTGTDTPRLGYAGQYTDPETGLQYLRARHYDPSTGSFLTRDPLVSLTREPYGYVGGDPVNRTDPWGLYWGEDFVDGAVEVVDAVTDYGIGDLRYLKPVAVWQWEHPDQHADVLQAVGNVASVVAVGSLMVGNAPVATLAGAVGATASGAELVQGLRACEDEHVVSGSIGLVTFGTGAGASKLATELGAGKAVQVIIAFYEAYFGYASSELGGQ
jgi:RHS repeat-associated protein